MRIPASFTIDVSGLDDFDKTIRVDSLTLSADVTILADPGQMITTVVRPRIEEEPEAEEELLEEGEEAEGEEAAAEATEGSEGSAEE